VKYLVTGGGGLIGSFLLPAIEANGDEVVDFDVRLGHDVMSEVHIEYVLRMENPDVVIHLAAQSGVETSRDNAFHSLNLNVVGTMNVLEACRIRGIKNVVVASSNHVYGDQKEWPVTEDAPMNQLDTYSASKICADVLTRAYAHNYDLNAVAVRLTNTFGPGDIHEDHIIPGTIQSILRGEAPVIRSEGQIRKSYLYGTDAADAFITIAQHCEELKGQAVNVVGCNPIASLNLVESILALTHSDLRPVILGEPNDQNHENMSAAKMAALGWKPKVGLYQGIEKTYTWFRKQVTQEVAV
jgi:CDP-glucose 4,6-dehydratase